MRSPTLHRPWRPAALAAALVAITTVEAAAIEMFTFFGDGSRIGLPSLEVPVEAYPGIPLRSDRLRARRRAMRMGPGSAVRIGPPGYARGITIRAMPEADAAPLRTLQQPALPARSPAGAADVVEDVPPLPPEPEEITPPSPRP